MNARWIAVVAAMALLTACGAATAPTTTPTLSPSSPPASAAATPTATPAPTPPPPPPLAIIQSRADSAVSAVDATGHVQWSLSRAALGRLLSATSSDNISARTAGPHLIVSRVPSTTRGPGRLVVLDRTGAQLASSSFTPLQFIDDVFGDPTGTQWAWSVDDSDPSASQSHGRIMVAGIGIAAHSVFSWAAPPNSSFEQVAGWTDMGIVMERIGLGGCGVGFHPDDASFLIDPAAGTLTNLFTDGTHYGDARHGVRVGFPARSASTVTVNGTAFDEGTTVANAAYVSPDGTRVGVQRFSLGGCAGETPSLNTEIIDVASGAHTDLAHCGISGWLDGADFACHAFGDTTVRLEGLDGHAVATLGNGDFVGAISGA